MPCVTQPTLRTDHIALVPLADEHLEFEVELDSDPEVLRYLNPGARSRAEVKQAHGRRMAVAGTVPGLGFWVGFVQRDFVGWWILQPPEGPANRMAPTRPISAIASSAAIGGGDLLRKDRAS
jgi:hypothetical protein